MSHDPPHTVEMVATIPRCRGGVNTAGWSAGFQITWSKGPLTQSIWVSTFLRSIGRKDAVSSIGPTSPDLSGNRKGSFQYP